MVVVVSEYNVGTDEAFTDVSAYRLHWVGQPEEGADEVAYFSVVFTGQGYRLPFDTRATSCAVLGTFPTYGGGCIFTCAVVCPD